MADGTATGWYRSLVEFEEKATLLTNEGLQNENLRVQIKTTSTFHDDVINILHILFHYK